MTIPISFPGFEIEQIRQSETTLTITASATSPTVACPACQQVSHRIHSYYTRAPHDLPVSGQAVRLVLRVRRFRCQNQRCPQQTFVERLPEVVPRYARRTTRLLTTLNLFAVALSGQAGACLLKQIGMAVSGDTLLRLAKRAESASVQAPKILGVDDFAFRRGRTYGTILVNLETHRPVDLLAERTADALIDWLKQHPGVEVISRDRSTEYARGASQGAPQAQQVADRWHLLKNLREAAERALKRMHAELVEQQKALGLPQAPRHIRRHSQTEIAASKVARVRRQARYEEVVALYKQGVSVLGIADQLHMSRGTVRNFVYAGAFPERATTLRAKSLLDPYLLYLEQRWEQGCRNGNQLWKELQAQGFVGGYKIVNRWLEPRREKPGRKHSQREKRLLGLTAEEETGTHSVQLEGESKGSTTPSAATAESAAVIDLQAPRHLVWLLLRNPSGLDERQQRTLRFLRQMQQGEELYALAQRYVRIMRERDVEAFDPWLEQCLTCSLPDLQTFAQGLQQDYSASKAALTLPYSNDHVA